MRKRNFILILICFLILISEKTKACKDVAVNEMGWSFQQPDGGYMLFGLKQNDTINEADMVIVKTDSKGDTIFIRNIKNVPVAFSFSDNMDMDYAGNFILAGVCDSANGNFFRIVKYSPDLNTSGLQTYKIPNDSFALPYLYDWRYIKGKGYLFFGQNKTWGYNTSFLSNSGKQYFTSGGDHNYELTNIGDAAVWNNQIVVTGDYVKGKELGSFIEIQDLSGKILKQHFFPAVSPVKTNAIQLCVSGNSFYIIGFYFSNTIWGDLYCIKTNQALDTEWTRIFPIKTVAVDTLTTSFSILGNTTFNNNALGVLIKSLDNGVPLTDILLKIDSSGSLVIHNSLSEYGSIIFNFSENHAKQIVMVATLNTEQTIDLHLILLDSTLSGISQPEAFSNMISIFPNPVSGNLNIHGFNPLDHSARFVICDETGKTMMSDIYMENQPINTDMLKPGIYFLRMMTSGGDDIKTTFVVR